MAAKTVIILIASLCSAYCKPLCPGMALGLGVPAGGATTVCESAPNLPIGLAGIGLHPLGLGGLGHLGLGSHLGLGLPLGLPYANPAGSTTVCETAPNLPAIGMAVPAVGSTTVCESAPNLPLGLGYGAYGPLGLGVPLGGATTVCESVPDPLLGLGNPLALASMLRLRPFL